MGKLRVLSRLVFCVLCFQILSASNCRNDDDIKDTVLLMTLLVHRHGDRTYDYAQRYSNEPDLLRKRSQPYGEGNLIDAGKSRSFELGKFFRKRYSSLLPAKMADLPVECSEFNRTIMTAHIAVTAAYSSEKEWREGMKLLPFACKVLPLQTDYYLVSVGNCPKFRKHFDVTSTKNPKTMSRFDSVMEELTPVFGTNLTLHDLAELPGLFYTQEELGIPLSPEIEDIMPAIKEAGDMGFEELFKNKEYIDVGAGLLLQEFLDRAEDVTSGRLAPRLMVYSAHDMNVYMLVEATRAAPQGAAKFCSAFALELRRVRGSGDIVVAAVYVDTPGEPKYLQVEGCRHKLCDFDIFKCTASKYALNMQEFKKKCDIA